MRIGVTAGSTSIRGLPRTHLQMGGVPTSRLRPTAPAFPAVRREGLGERLTCAVRDFPLTVVRAPAGYGKTAAATAWAARAATPDRVAWLSLTERDDAPLAFWWHVVSALAFVGAIAPELRDAIAPDAADADALAEQLLLLEAPVILVLDAVDRVHNADVFAQLCRLLDTAGERLRILMTTRVEPPLPLHRYRVEGTVAELGLHELAFGPDDIRTVLAIHGVGATDAMAQHVEDLTEGWPAGVRMAARSLQAGGGLTDLDGQVGTYMRAEVLEDLAPDEQRILAQTSISDQLPVGLATALTGRQDADDVLRRLSYGNSFVHTVPGQPRRLRIHPLLRELLRTELGSTSPDVARDLHAQASDWFESQGDLVDAVRHAASAGRWAGAAEMAVRGRGVGELALRTPAGVELSGLLSSSPDLDVAEMHLARAAVALAASDLAEADGRLSTCLAMGPDAALSRSAAVLRTMVCAASGEAQETLRAGVLARQLIDRDGVDPGRWPLRALVACAEGTARMRLGDLERASQAFTEAAAEDVGFADLRVRCLANLGLLDASRGRLSRGSDLADSAEQLAQEYALPAGGRPAAIHLTRAWVGIERQNLSPAQKSLKATGRLRETSDDPLLRAVSSLLRARLTRDSPDGASAQALLRDEAPFASWLLSSSHMSQQVHELLERAQKACAAGDPGRARSCILDALSLARGEELRRPFTHLTSDVRAMIRTDPRLRSHAAWLTPGGATDLRVALEAGRGGSPLPQQLSDRELEVLRHLEALLTTEEIASEMFISVNTVRTHVRNVLSKLGVSRRNDAVRRGRDLRLV